ncbi:hypothetical protein [Streptomyces sp. JJ38]|uniref:hypothetical protein n=1 Tax=Streptomyces sp. JJ38 TaxID=2738128 RepID=UPI001C577C03|nr:hypothetical protein [Streptomyces sp. JJ38]MBW1597744.1 hypothetical protein [Streptomyces sp. JJ38]
MSAWAARASRRLHDIWGEHPSTDLFVAALATLLSALWLNHHALSEHPAGQRMNIYAAVASVAAIVGGFGAAAISQYASNSGQRMTFLRQRFGPSLRRNWVSILTSMVSVSGGCLLIMIADSGRELGWLGWVVQALILLGALRAIRLIWLFRLLIDVADHDGTSGHDATPITVVDRTSGHSLH